MTKWIIGGIVALAAASAFARGYGVDGLHCELSSISCTTFPVFIEAYSVTTLTTVETPSQEGSSNWGSLEWGTDEWSN